MISRTSAYALEAALILASHPDERVRANELAESLDLPGNYLSKILNSMARAGLLISERGPRGGFRLKRGPDQIVIGDIIGLFEETGSSRRCFLGRGTCSDKDGCAMHDRWKAVSGPVFDFFENTTLATLVQDRARGRRSARTPQPHP